MQNENDELADMLLSPGMQFGKIFDVLLEGIQIHDFDWRYIYVNDALVKYSTYSKEDLLGHTLFEKYPGIEQTNLFSVLSRCMKGRIAENLETEFIFPDGSIAFFELSIQPIPEGLFILSVDKSEQKKANEKLLLVNRLLAFISKVNQSIVHINDQETLFQNACSIAIELGEFRMAWIGLFDADRKEISLTNQCGIPAEDFHLFINAPFQRNGPQDYVLRTGTYFICNDIEHDLELQDWKPYALKYSLRSCIVLPIRKSGQIIGTFNLYTTKSGFRDKEEIQLLEQIAGEISFALDNYERAKKQRAAEELMLLNEKRFRTLIERGGDMKTLSTEKGKMLYCSPSIVGILGYSVVELMSEYSPDFIHPDDIRSFEENREKILKTPGASFDSRVRFRHKNGNWIWCEGTITNMIDEPGINALVSNFRDISEKKVNENEREFEKNNLFALINNTYDLMWSIDKEYKLITFNEPFFEVIKQVAGIELKKGDSVFSAVLSSDQSARFTISYKRAFSGEIFTEIEYFKEPIESWSEISYYPIRKGHEVIGTACHSRDISQRKLAEKKLVQSESRLKEAQALAHISNWEIDLVHNIHTWSDELYNIYRVNQDEIKPSTEMFLSFMHPADAAIAKRNIEHSFKTLEDSTYNFRFIRSDGIMRYGYVERKFEFDENHQPVRLYGIMQDVTETRIAQEKLEEQNAELIKINQELDRFVYSVSHDLRSPLTSMLGLISFIEEDSNEPDTLEHAGMIKGSINRLDGFIKNILSYSQNNRTELEPEYIPLQTTVETIVDLLHSMEEAKDIHFVVAIEEEEPFYSDKQRFTIAIENLVSNAIKYHSKALNGRYISITGRTDKNSLELAVSDNGIGIAPEDQAKIFEMFIRLPGNVAGSGIGLYLVKEVLEKLQGSIRVSSEEGKGSSFIIKLKNLKQ